MTEKVKTRIILILIAIIGLSATVLVCYLINPYRLSESKEADISPQHRAYAERALEIADEYLDYEISADSAYILIEELKQRESELPNTNGTNDIIIESIITRLSASILLADIEPSSEYYNETLKARNELAELVGEKER